MPNSRSPLSLVRKDGSWPLWAKISVCAAAFIVIAVIAGFAAIGIKYTVIEAKANAADPIELDGYYYYNSLSWRDQQLYDVILSAANDALERTEVLPYTYDMETFENVVRCVEGDNPDLFYVRFNDLVINHGRHKTYVTMVYRETGEALTAMRTEYAAALDLALTAADGLKTDFERELAVHDMLVEKCSYANGETDDIYNTAYGALVLEKAYCDGYAYAIKAMLDRMNVSSAIVYGSVNEAEHVWNLVRVGGKYYHLDAMWNDADLSYDADMLFHGYFNVDDNRILLDHSYYYDDLLPEATDGTDYYKELGLYAETVGECEEIFYNSLLDAKADGRQYIELFCKESINNEQLATHFKNAVLRANETLGEEVFMTAFVVHSAAERTNAATVQIFYN